MNLQPINDLLCREWLQSDSKELALKKELETFFYKYFIPDPISDAHADNQKQIAEAFSKLSKEAQNKIKEYLHKHLKTNNQDASDEVINAKIQNNLDDDYFGIAVCACVSDLRSKFGV